MGIIWEAYHKGVPLLGVPENPIEMITGKYTLQGTITYPTFGKQEHHRLKLAFDTEIC